MMISDSAAVLSEATTGGVGLEASAVLQEQTVRIGAISFVNTIPIYAAYQVNEGNTLDYDVPARLNAKIRAGELDISPVSSACYLREKNNLVLLEDLSVSSPGAVESVIFLSKTPLGPQLLELEHLYIPNDSETSVTLLAYLLQEATGQNLCHMFQVYEAPDYLCTLQTNGNTLIIGDNALLVQEALRNGELSDFYCYDLSTLWKEKTGLPFVFAVWVANRSWAEQHPEDLQAVNQGLCSARDRFYAEPLFFQEGLALAQSKSNLPRETLERYYRHCLNYTLSGTHRQSLAHFESILHAFSNAPF